jgi:hypothetical protein
MKQLSRGEINDIWMRSSDIYDFAYRVQQASDDQSLSAVQKYALDTAPQPQRETLFGLQSGDSVEPR